MMREHEARRLADTARLWAASEDPIAMLEALRALVDAGLVASPGEALRRFAAHCAVLFGDGPGTHLAQIAEWQALGDFEDGDLDALRREAAPMATLAVEVLELLSYTGNRREAAVKVASFRALDPDPLHAAIGAARVMTRYAATDAAGAAAMARYYAQLLRVLVPAPFGETGTPPLAEPRDEELPPWTPVERNDAAAQAGILRVLRAWGPTLLERDPWIPVPQRGCSYAFGADERPLPIAALVHLWRHWPAATGTCPRCGGDVLAFTVGGMRSKGGVLGCCTLCERAFLRQLGGAARVAELITPVLEDTPYHVARVLNPDERIERGPEELEEAVAALRLEDLLA